MIIMTVPRSISEITSMPPLWSIIILRAMASPKPVPPVEVLVEKNGSKILFMFADGIPLPVSPILIIALPVPLFFSYVKDDRLYNLLETLNLLTAFNVKKL